MTTVDVDQAGQWLPLRDAALSLHVAEKTARRRVKAGTLRGRQVSTVHGAAWEVWVPSSPGVDTEGSPVGTQSPELLRALDLVGKLQQQNLELAGRVGYYQAEVEQLRTTLKALQAPNPVPEPASPSPDAVETPPDSPGRPWYQRLLFG